MSKIYFVTGIDTDAGKTWVTAAILSYLRKQGVKATTFKLIQTGSEDGRSIDIDAHRRLANMPEDEHDRQKLTYPEVYTYPASPHLAAEIDQRPIDFNKIESALAKVAQEYDVVLVEGAGGIMVPLTRTLLTIDYVAKHQWETLLVTSGKLGSINHTLLSLEALKSRQIPLAGVLYNAYPEADKIIGKDTEKFLQEFIKIHYPECGFANSPLYTEDGFYPEPDFSTIFKGAF